MTEPVLGRRERKKEETKRRIFVAAVELFHDKGFDHTTVDEITERADVAKGTFFNYFPRKESVLAYVREEWLEQVEEQAAQKNRPAAERLRAFLQTIAAAFGEDRVLAHAVIHTGMQQMVCPEEAQSHGRLATLVKEAIRDGQASGEFRADVDPAMVFLVLAATFMGTMFWWAGHDHHGDVEMPNAGVRLGDVLDAQLRLVFDGILAAPAGRARG